MLYMTEKLNIEWLPSDNQNTTNTSGIGEIKWIDEEGFGQITWLDGN
jgi:hypothetical protein